MLQQEADILISGTECHANEDLDGVLFVDGATLEADLLADCIVSLQEVQHGEFPPSLATDVILSDASSNSKLSDFAADATFSAEAMSSNLNPWLLPLEVESVREKEIESVKSFLANALRLKDIGFWSIKSLHTSYHCTLVLVIGKYLGSLHITGLNISFRGKYVPLKQRASEESRNLPETISLCWSMKSLLRCYPRRYMLRDIAIELFFSDRRNFLFVFASQQDNIPSLVRSESSDSVNEKPVLLRPVSVRLPAELAPEKAPVCSTPNAERGFVFKLICALTKIPQELSPARHFEMSQVESRWKNWEISNFEYLMQLNTFAGRSYSDLSQYPIFPWILRDFSSSLLRLDLPESFRNFCRSVGGQNEYRFETAKSLYKEKLIDPVEGEPPFMWGSHYSTTG